jgi:hypothetical protein
VTTTDPAACLDLVPGERVLWTGRPGFGAPWRELRPRLLVSLAIWLVGLAGLGALSLLPADSALALPAPGRAVFVWSSIIGAAAAALALARLLGPYHLSLFVLCAFGPGYALAWSELVARRGFEGAVESLAPGHLLCVGVLVGVPLARIALAVTERLATVYVVTDRRAAEVRLGLIRRGPRCAWTAPLRGEDDRLLARAIRPWGWARRGHVAIGVGRARRELSMIEEPERVLAEVRAAGAPLAS